MARLLLFEYSPKVSPPGFEHLIMTKDIEGLLTGLNAVGWPGQPGELCGYLCRTATKQVHKLGAAHMLA